MYLYAYNVGIVLGSLQEIQLLLLFSVYNIQGFLIQYSKQTKLWADDHFWEIVDVHQQQITSKQNLHDYRMIAIAVCAAGKLLT